MDEDSREVEKMYQQVVTFRALAKDTTWQVVNNVYQGLFWGIVLSAGYSVLYLLKLHR
jgi:hypothetical protein